MKKVTLGRDFGTEIEATDGLDGTEDVITNPGQKIAEGRTVLVQEKPRP